MKAFKFIVLTSLLIGMFAATTVALAGKVHFLVPDFSLGSGLAIEGEFVVLETEEFEVSLIAAGTVTAICEDEAGNQAYGQNPVPIEVSEAKLVIGRPDRPAKVEVHAPDPTAPGNEPNPTPEQAGCPEGNWIVVEILDHSTDWTAANLVITDLEGVVQVDKNYTCTTIFRDYLGLRVDCEEV
jgi:hypothetical protein